MYVCAHSDLRLNSDKKVVTDKPAAFHKHPTKPKLSMIEKRSMYFLYIEANT